MPRRIDAAPILAGLGGLLLFVSLLLDWYEPDLSPWTVFEIVDLLLAAAALCALAYAAQALGAPLRLPSGLLTVLGVAAFVLVVSQLLNPPPRVAEESDLETGAWLALAGVTILLIGALLSRVGVSLAVDVDRGAAGPPPAGGAPGAPGRAPAPPGASTPPPGTMPSRPPEETGAPPGDETTTRLDDETRGR